MLTWLKALLDGALDPWSRYIFGWFLSYFLVVQFVNNHITHELQ